MYILESEWDVGETGLVFASKEACNKWLRNNEHIQKLAYEECETIQEFIEGCFDDGYFFLHKVELIE